MILFFQEWRDCPNFILLSLVYAVYIQGRQGPETWPSPLFFSKNVGHVTSNRLENTHTAEICLFGPDGHVTVMTDLLRIC